MCITTFYKSPTCEHWWAEILKPCKKGRDFSNCPSFRNGMARNPRKYPRYKAEKDSCPKCDKEDDYDGDKVRVIKKVYRGFRFGLGPGKDSLGVDCRCSVM